MKMVAADYEQLKKAIDAGIAEIGIDQVKTRIVRPQDIGSDMRFRWYLMSVSGLRLGDGAGMKTNFNVYSYLNDAHIDTALMHYVKNNKDLTK